VSAFTSLCKRGRGKEGAFALVLVIEMTFVTAIDHLYIRREKTIRVR